jgi:hypothetical protein
VVTFESFAQRPTTNATNLSTTLYNNSLTVMQALPNITKMAEEISLIAEVTEQESRER